LSPDRGGEKRNFSAKATTVLGRTQGKTFIRLRRLDGKDEIGDWKSIYLVRSKMSFIRKSGGEGAPMGRGRANFEEWGGRLTENQIRGGLEQGSGG